MKCTNIIQILLLRFVLGFQNCNTAVTVKLTGRRCRLPKFPPNGKYQLLNDKSNYIPGSYVDEYSSLDIQCNPGSNRINDLYSVCINSTWYPPLSNCLKTCPTLHSTSTTTFTCVFNDVPLDNCESPLEGTIAKIKCGDFYEGPGAQFALSPECRNGNWDFNIFYCQPICGVKHDTKPNLINTIDSKKDPWHVTVYNKHQEQICSGAVISPQIVLSAAYCFSDPKNGELLPKDNYILAVRKYYRSYYHPSDSLAQYSSIKDIKVPVRYKGAINRYESDIAIITLTTPFTLSAEVQPVCFDLTNSHEHEELIPTNKGVISGWGQSENNTNCTETLKELEIPFVEYKLCYEKVTKELKTFITHDKICGEYVKKSESICNGDIGGSLAFQNNRDNRYYIRGIVSILPNQNDSQCNSNQFSVFTRVSKFKDLIVRRLRKTQYLLPYCSAGTFHCASGECVPKHNECDGEANCQDKSDETENCRITPCKSHDFFRCNYGACVYKNTTCDGKQDCIDNSDEELEECSTVTYSQDPNQCRLPEFPSNGKYLINEITYYRPGSYVKELSVLSVQCDPGYKTDTAENYVSWFSGIWKVTLPKCVGTSIRTPSTTQSTPINGTSAIPTDIILDALKKFPTCGPMEAELRSFCISGVWYAEPQKCVSSNIFNDFPLSTTPIDETTELTNTEAPLEPSEPSDECRLPELPPNGRYVLLGFPNYIPGSYVNEFTTLSLQCEPGFLGNEIKEAKLLSSCIDGVWFPKPQKCVKPCRSLYSTPSTTITCKLGDSLLKNCENPIDETNAEFKCADFYEGPDSQYSFPRECIDGNWNYEPFQCRPRCGIKNDKAVTNVSRGDNAKHGSYPWQVAVYKLQEQICGGAILTRRIVLSAAHCFTVPQNGNLLPKENYMIAAGKYYRTYDHPSDTLAQYSGVKEIHVPKRYKGAINYYEADIAIIILGTPFSFSAVVQPVCIDITNSYEHEQLIPNTRGSVSGWGQTVKIKNVSEVLNELEVPFVDYEACYAAVPNNFRRFLTYDKICGGYLNEGKSACQEDSGGALSFRNVRDNKFYVRGIVSFSPTQNESRCNSNQYSLFTKVSIYKDFINSYYNLPDNFVN